MYISFVELFNMILAQRTLLLGRPPLSLQHSIALYSKYQVCQGMQWMGMRILYLEMEAVHIPSMTIPAGGEWTWVQIRCQSLKFT